MSDILICGMELPKQGRITLQIGSDGAVYVVDKCEITAEKYEKNFKVFEVPPYGRLIDADALLKKCEFVCTDDDEDIRAVRYSIIENAPTIIPADDPKEE